MKYKFRQKLCYYAFQDCFDNDAGLAKDAGPSTCAALTYIMYLLPWKITSCDETDILGRHCRLSCKHCSGKEHFKIFYS